jgi:hypothetical protein
MDDPATTLARLPTQIRLKAWAYMVNDQLFSAVSPVRRSAAGCRPSGNYGDRALNLESRESRGSPRQNAIVECTVSVIPRRIEGATWPMEWRSPWALLKSRAANPGDPKLTAIGKLSKDYSIMLSCTSTKVTYASCLAGGRSNFEVQNDLIVRK